MDDVQRNKWNANNFDDLNCFSGRMSQVVEKLTTEELEAQLLAHLDFRDLTDREERISDAHVKTFQWVFKRDIAHSPTKWIDLATWLEGNDVIYWVTGKAGSGKSTLMKFIFKNPQVYRHLGVWAEDMPLIIAKFYFWNSGTQIQMSQEGLLRTLLYEILTARPGLLASVFPRRWRRSQSSGGVGDSWSLPELTKAFKLLAQMSKDSFKLCLFIDGLDEFDGDHENLIELIKGVVAERNIKVCLSSRPWPVFEDAFSAEPSLMVQNLTFPDIVAFTEESLCSSVGFRRLEAREPNFASELAKNISIKSSGVFLWVSLVVKSLLTGLSNCDRVSDMQRRLDELPGDLEEFYEKMFSSIEPFYAKHASQLLQIAREAKGTLSVLEFSLADEEDPKLAIRMKVAPMSDEERLSRSEAMRMRLNSRCKGFLEIPQLTEAEIESIEALTTTRQSIAPVSSRGIRSWRPLMSAEVGSEIDEDGKFNLASEDYSRPEALPHLCDIEGSVEKGRQPSNQKRLSVIMEDSRGQTPEELQAKELGSVRAFKEMSLLTSPKRIRQDSPFQQLMPCLALADRKVAYLHRTAKDFLESSRIRQRLLVLSGPSFQPQLSIARSSMLFLKTLSVNEADNTSVFKCIDKFMQNVATAENTLEEAQVELIDELDRAAAELLGCTGGSESSARHWSDRIHSGGLTTPKYRLDQGFIAYAATYDVQLYVQTKIEQGIRIFLKDPTRPILDFVIAEYKHYGALREETENGCHVPSLSLVHWLLNQGMDPNQSYEGQTTWERALEQMSRSRLEEEEQEHWADVIGAFLRHGADPSMARHPNTGGSYFRQTFRLLPARARELERLLKAKSQFWSTPAKFTRPKLKTKRPPGVDRRGLQPVANKLRKIV